MLFAFVAISAAYADEPKIINTGKTDAHQSIFEIPVYIVPATGLNLTKTRDGCVDKLKKVSIEGSQIRVAYRALLEEFNEQNLKKAGVDLKLKSEFIWNGTPATLLKVFQKSRTSVMGKWILIIDRGQDTWMINGLYEAKDPKRGEAVLSMLKSVCWDAEDENAALLMPLGNVTAEGTPLRLAGLRQGAFVYTKDGSLPTKSEDGSLFVVSRQRDTCVGLDKQARFAKERLAQIEKGRKFEIISEKNIIIDGLNGIELVAYTEEKPKDLIYQTLLFDYKDSHVLVGIARGNAPENLDIFHKLAESYKQGL